MIKYSVRAIGVLIVAAILILSFSFTIGWNKQLFKGGDQWGYNAYLVSIFSFSDLRTLDKTYEANARR